MTERIPHHRIEGLDDNSSDKFVELAFKSNRLIDQMRQGGYASKAALDARNELAKNNEMIVNISSGHSGSADDGSVQHSPGNSESHEPKSGMTKERISEIAADSVFVAHTAFDTEGVPEDKTTNPGAGGFKTVFNKNLIIDGNRKSLTSFNMSFKQERLMDGYIDSGVSELVTKVYPRKDTTFGEFDPLSIKADEKVVGIHYMTLSGSGSRSETRDKYPHDSGGRRGNRLDVFMVLPESDATELVSAIHEDPNTIRQLIDTQMREQVGAGSAWDKAKPPYLEWQEINGGVSRIALRSDSQQGVESSHVLEFQAV